LQERKLAATIDLGKPLRPHRAELGRTVLLYVTAEMANAVDVIDPSHAKVWRKFRPANRNPTCWFCHATAAAPTRPNVGAGSVSVLRPREAQSRHDDPWQKVSSAFPFLPDGPPRFTTTRTRLASPSSDTATNKITNWIEIAECGVCVGATPDGAGAGGQPWLANHLHVVDLQR